VSAIAPPCLCGRAVICEQSGRKMSTKFGNAAGLKVMDGGRLTFLQGLAFVKRFGYRGASVPGTTPNRVAW